MMTSMDTTSTTTNFIIEIQMPKLYPNAGFTTFYYAGKKRGQEVWRRPVEGHGRIKTYKTEAGAERVAVRMRRNNPMTVVPSFHAIPKGNC